MLGSCSAINPPHLLHPLTCPSLFPPALAPPPPPPGATTSYFGWDSKITGRGTYTFDLYATVGGSACSLSGAIQVGTATVRVQYTTITVSYDLFTPYVMSSANVYIGTTKPSSSSTINYGANLNAFTYKYTNLASVTTYSFSTSTIPSYPFYVLPVAVVGGAAAH